MEAQSNPNWKQFEDLKLEDPSLLQIKGGDGDEDDGEGIIIDDIIVGG